MSCERHEARVRNVQPVHGKPTIATNRSYSDARKGNRIRLAVTSLVDAIRQFEHCILCWTGHWHRFRNAHRLFDVGDCVQVLYIIEKPGQ